MKWYLITTAPQYAVNEDCSQVINIHTKKVISHNSTTTAKDGLRRVTLYYKNLFMGKYRSKKRVYIVEQLKCYVKQENLLTNIKL